MKTWYCTDMAPYYVLIWYPYTCHLQGISFLKRLHWSFCQILALIPEESWKDAGSLRMTWYLVEWIFVSVNLIVWLILDEIPYSDPGMSRMGSWGAEMDLVLNIIMVSLKTVINFYLNASSSRGFLFQRSAFSLKPKLLHYFYTLCHIIIT